MRIEIATDKDLKYINEMFENVVNKMRKDGIKIWNEYYPFEVFFEDIKNKRLFLLKEKDVLIGAAALADDEFAYSECFKWAKPGKYTYITRFAITPKFLNRGYGSTLLQLITDIAKEKGFDTLRLCVARINIPAIKLYEKYGFKRVEGELKNKFITECDCIELGYEKQI